MQEGERYTTDDGYQATLQDLRRFAACDLAASTKTRADYTAVVVLGSGKDGRLFVLDLLRERLQGPDVVPVLERLTASWKLAFLSVEKAGFQLALIQDARRRGLPVREVSPDRDKVSRALPLAAALEGGRVYLPRTAPWLSALEDELLSFPAGKHDDQVDALAYGVLAARELEAKLVDLGGFLPRGSGFPRGLGYMF
jgi:predicted phage terminase large subunit-like protein